MRKKNLINLIRVWIFLLPLPFGCVGNFFSPLFYILILITSWFAFSIKDEELLSIKTKMKLKETIIKKRIPFQRQIFLFLNLFIFFLFFQLIPMPTQLIKILSPNSLKSISYLQGDVSRFHSISLVPDETLLFLLEFLVILVLVIALFRIKFTKQDITLLINTLILSAAIQSLFALVKYATGNDYFFLFFRKLNKKMVYLTGTLGNPDHFAFWLEMTIPLVLAMFFLKVRLFEGRSSIKDKLIAAVNESWLVILYLLTFVLLGTAVVLSGSRSGIITLIISLIIFLQLSVYHSWTRQIRGKMKYLLIALALVIIFLGAQNTFDKFLDSSYTKGGRFIRWPNTISLFMDFPIFGTGFGTYKYALFPYDELDKWSKHAHNDYLEILSDGGLIGTLIFFTLIFFLTASLARMWIKRRHPQMKILGIGCLCSLFVALFHSLLDFPLRIPSNIFILLIIFLLGIKVSTYKREF